MTQTWVLVGCGSAKLDDPAPARDLYTSSYFSLKREYAELAGDSWAILSAEHALLDPDQVVEPYDTELDDVDLEEWVDRVATSLRAAAPTWERVEIVLLAGTDYSEPVLEADLPDSWYVRRPFDEVDGGLFEQQSWLSERVDAGVGTTRRRRGEERAENWQDAVRDLAQRWGLEVLAAERALADMDYSPPPHEPELRADGGPQQDGVEQEKGGAAIGPCECDHVDGDCAYCKRRDAGVPDPGVMFPW